MAATENNVQGAESRVSTMDRIVAAFFLVYFAPLMLAVALVVRFDSRGPILERRRQRRAGGDVVEFLEFRTMLAERAKCGVASCAANRYTPSGGFLRISRLDLLPRLLNTLRGEIPFLGLLR